MVSSGFGMQVIRWGFLSAMVAAALGCAAVPVQQWDGWMGKPFGEPLARIHNLLSADSVAAVPRAEIRAALQRLESSDAVPLQQEDPLLRSAGIEIEAGYYLVRAERDDFVASYRIYQKEGRLLILYSHMGGCGPAIKDALIVRSEFQIADVYGGCSGAL